MDVLAADVIVVGGGPAGSATATHLVRRGYDVLLLDRAAFPREKPCGEYLSPGVIDALARLGALDAVRAASPAWPEGMLIVAPRASVALRYPDGAGPRRALGIPRVVLDRLLLDHARAAGARVRERARVTGVVREGGRVGGVQVRVGQETVTLRSRFVVGADGVHSTVSRALGLDLPTRWPRRLGLVARYAGASLGPTAEMHASRRAYCGIAPVGPDLVCVGLVVPLGDKPGGERTADYFERRIRALPGAARALADAHRVTPIRGVGPIARRVRRVSGPGFLLVGDAAGFLDPFTGEGVFRALRGAEIAADALDAALRTDAGAPIGYEAARRAAFGDKERLCALVQLFLASGRPLDYVVGRLGPRARPAAVLAGALGDYRPASDALTPRFLWSLLKP